MRNHPDQPGDIQHHGIIAEPLRDGVRVKLPPRPLSFAQRSGSGWLVILYSLLPFTFAIFWVLAASGAISGFNDDADSTGGLIILWAIPIWFAGMFILAEGLTVLVGRHEVEMVDGELKTIVRIGPFKRTWKRSAKHLRRMVIERADGQQGDEDQNALLIAYFTDAPALAIVTTYPAMMLRRLAIILADAHAEAAARTLNPTSGTVTGVGVMEKVIGANENQRCLRIDAHGSAHEIDSAQPINSDAIVEKTHRSLTIILPKLGAKGAKGLPLFALLYFSLVVIATVIEVFDESPESLSFFIAMPLFWLVGIGLVLSVMHMARRHAIIDVVDDTLLITRGGLFGLRQQKWRRSDLKTINVGPGLVRINNQPVNQLHIHSHNGEKATLFSERDDNELKWLAATLCDAMALNRLPKTQTTSEF